MARSSRYDAIIWPGGGYKGTIPRTGSISAPRVTRGIAAVGEDSKIPVVYGVITPDTLEQAIERAGTKAGNKGFDAAMAAIEMANCLRN